MIETSCALNSGKNNPYQDIRELFCVTLAPLAKERFTFSRNSYSCKCQYSEWWSSCFGTDDYRGSQETESQAFGTDSRYDFFLTSRKVLGNIPIICSQTGHPVWLVTWHYGWIFPVQSLKFQVLHQQTFDHKWNFLYIIKIWKYYCVAYLGH